MNRFDIRDILNAHKEHFRVLPDSAQNALNGVIEAIDHDYDQEKLLTEQEWGKLKAMNQEAISIRETAEKRSPKKKVNKKVKKKSK